MEESIGNYFPNICRICMVPALSSEISSIRKFHSIYESSEINNFGNNATQDSSTKIMKISEIWMQLTSIEIEDVENYGLSEQICANCLENLIKSFSFRQLCIDSYHKMKNYYEPMINIEVKTETKSTENINEALNDCNVIKDDLDHNPFELEPELIQENEDKKLEIKKENVKTENSNKHNSGVKKKDEKQKKFECLLCGKTFTRNYHLKRHTTNVHKKTNDRPTNQQTIESSLNKAIKQESQTTSLLSIDIETNSRETEDFTQSCENCHKTFNKMYLFKEHKCEANHSFVCNVCGKKCGSNEKLTIHMNRHSGKKPSYVCHVCNKAFRQSCTLKEHLRTHSGEQPFLCSECGKAFNNPSNLRQHQIRHTGIKLFQCEECPSRFISKDGLKSHMRTHTKIKPYTCDTCGTSFTKMSSLTKHKRIHTGEKPYPCDVCDKRFNSSDNAKRHMRTHTGEKPYVCKHCNHAFTQSYDLVKHIRHHIGEKIYQCDECTFAFRLFTELKEHKREHFLQNKNNNELNSSNLT